MSTNTNNLSLVLTETSQMDKERTVNAALVKLDAILNTGAKDKDLATPPGSPSAGDLYIVAASPTGGWSGQAGKIAYYTDSWNFIAPKEGMRLWVNDEDVVYVYNGSAWAVMTQGGGASGIRNLLHNGAMVIDQRYEGASTALSSGTGAYAVDRWVAKFVNSTASGVTCQRVTDAPSGFTHSIKLTVGTGASSIGSSDWMGFCHAVKGCDFKHMAFGTAAAGSLSLSFWVKSSISGTFAVALEEAGGSRAYTAAFTISATNTWERKTIDNIPGDTSGTWTATSASSIRLHVMCGAGTSFQTSTLASWRADSFKAANTITNTHLTTTGATFQISGVQLEPGILATSFEMRPQTLEKILCKAHYRKSFPEGTAPAQNAGTTGAIGIIQPVGSSASTGFGWQTFDVEMRAAPTITLYNPSAANAHMRNLTSGGDTSGTTTAAASPLGFRISATTASSGGAGSTNAYHMTADADIT